MATENDTAPTLAERIPLINPALPIDKTIELLARHAAALHDLVLIICHQHQEPDLDDSPSMVCDALEPTVGLVNALAQAAVMRSLKEQRHG